MTASALVFAFVVLVAISYAGLVPLLTNPQAAERRKTVKHQDDDVEGLETQYQRLLNSIRDLDFDYDTAKVTDEVYAEQRKFLIGRSVSILRQLDGARSQIADIEDEIEAAIVAKRVKSSKSTKDNTLEKKIATRRKRRQKVSS
jgi:hypothetical protein